MLYAEDISQTYSDFSTALRYCSIPKCMTLTRSMLSPFQTTWSWPLIPRSASYGTLKERTSFLLDHPPTLTLSLTRNQIPIINVICSKARGVVGILYHYFRCHPTPKFSVYPYKLPHLKSGTPTSNWFSWMKIRNRCSGVYSQAN